MVHKQAMQGKRNVRGVALPEGHTGSSLLHTLLVETAQKFPEVFGSAELPEDPSAFKRDYGRALARFEAARCGAANRVEIARHLIRKTQEALQFVDSAAKAWPLRDYLRSAPEQVSLSTEPFQGSAGLSVEVPFEGKLLRGQQVRSLAERLYDARQLTSAARAALFWIVDYADKQGGSITLRDQRFVLLGAGAELAPTPLLLRAGASVLWVDLEEPSLAGQRADLSGSLVRSPQARDLLNQPREIAAAIRAFASDGPVHIGMFAYAGGETQEWRLGAAMNAIVATLAPEIVRSIALLVSPTSPESLTPETLAWAEERRRTAPWWQRLLHKSGLFTAPGHYAQGEQAVALSTVSLQGLSYQAAQYMSKIIAAEAYAAFGPDVHGSVAAPLTVSANVAGITRTRSLAHPLFEAAFAGAHHFDVRIFDANTTRALSGLLMLHDLLNPEAPGSATRAAATSAERAARQQTQQIHGGIYGLPFVLEGVIRMAAVLGLSRHPSLLLKKPAKPAPRPPAPVASAPAARAAGPISPEAPKPPAAQPHVDP